MPLPGAPDWVVANAGGPRLLPGRLRAGAAATRLTAEPAPCSSRSSASAWSSDCFALTQAGWPRRAGVPGADRRFRDETDRNVWAVLIGALAYVNRAIDDGARTRARGSGPGPGRAGRPPRSAGRRDRRGRADPPAAWRPPPGLGGWATTRRSRREARELYARYRADERAVDPNVLPALIAILARAGARPSTRSSCERFRHARSPQEEQRYLYALAAFRQPALIAQTLQHTVDGEIRSQDAPYVVRAVLVERLGARPGVGVREGPLGDHASALPAERLPPVVRRRQRSGSPGVGEGGAGLLPGARDRARREDPGAVPRAAAGGHPLPGARGRPASRPISLDSEPDPGARRRGAAERPPPSQRSACSNARGRVDRPSCVDASQAAAVVPAWRPGAGSARCRAPVAARDLLILRSEMRRGELESCDHGVPARQDSDFTAHHRADRSR